MTTLFPLLALAATCAGLFAADAAPTLAVRADRLHTLARGTITNGVVLITGTKITAVGPAADLRIPAGTRVLEAQVVTPGLIDAHSTVGLSGFLNQPHDQEQLEKSAPIQPELRALDSYNPRDPLVGYVRALGFTTLHTGHGPGAAISGQTIVVKTWPPDVDQAVLVPSAMIAATLGPGALSDSKDKPPGSSAKVIALLRTELLKAREYARKRQLPDLDKQPALDLRQEALLPVLDGKQPLLITVHRHLDIRAALRLADEFKLRLVLDGVADVPWVLDDIKASGFPVIVHPPMARPIEESQNLSLETPARLQAAGIPFAFQSGYESYVPKTRIALFEAAMAIPNGLRRDDALAALTLHAARILGVQDRIGSLEPGKDADLALFDGDPFEFTTHCTATVVSGTVTDTTPR